MSLIPKDAKHSCITSLHHFCGKWILGAKITKQEQAKKNIRLASAPLFTSHLQINRAYCLVLMSNKKNKKQIIIFHFPSTPVYHSSGDQMRSQAREKRLPRNVEWRRSSRRRRGRGTWDKLPLTRISWRRRKEFSGKMLSED